MESHDSLYTRKKLYTEFVNTYIVAIKLNSESQLQDQPSTNELKKKDRTGTSAQD